MPDGGSGAEPLGGAAGAELPTGGAGAELAGGGTGAETPHGRTGAGPWQGGAGPEVPHATPKAGPSSGDSAAPQGHPGSNLPQARRGRGVGGAAAASAEAAPGNPRQKARALDAAPISPAPRGIDAGAEAASPSLRSPRRGAAKPPLHGSAAAPRRARLMGRDQAAAFITAIARHNPEPATELLYTDAFSLLVSVVLSAQTTDAAVNKATPALFAEAPTPAAMAALGAERIGAHIRRIGLWQAKAKNVAALSAMLVAGHAGEVPADRVALEALPGVGRKTANVVLNVVFGESTMAVDTHIFRLGNRTGLAPGKNVRLVEDGLVKRIPAAMLRDAHHWLILHGRYICRARLPECWRCPGRELCNYKDKVLTARLKS